MNNPIGYPKNLLIFSCIKKKPECQKNENNFFSSFFFISGGLPLYQIVCPVLLKVPDLEFSDTIQPVCLPTLDTFNPLDFELGFFGYGRKHSEKTSK